MSYPSEDEFEITKKDSKKLWDKLFGTEYTVESMDYFRKKEGEKYIVRHKGDDTWTCNCKSWIFKSGTFAVRDIDTNKVHDRTCKHIRFVMDKEGLHFMNWR